MQLEVMLKGVCNKNLKATQAMHYQEMKMMKKEMEMRTKTMKAMLELL
jgi:hypothetical protein